MEFVVCILFISVTKSFITKLMKDTTLIKDKDLAYEVYLVSKKYFVVTGILGIYCKLIIIYHCLLFYFWKQIWTLFKVWIISSLISHKTSHFFIYNMKCKLNNCMEQTQSWETTSHSALWEFFHFLWNLKIHHHVQNGLSWMWCVHACVCVVFYALFMCLKKWL